MPMGWVNTVQRLEESDPKNEILEPSCENGSGVGPCNVAGARNITHDYANGWLTNVREGSSSWGSITYHVNGMVDTVTHNNLVQSVYGLDPQKMQRPASVTAKYGTTTYWTSGTYLYDSSGNVRAAGNDDYVDDLLGRLTQGTSERASSTIYKQQNQTYGGRASRPISDPSRVAMGRANMCDERRPGACAETCNSCVCSALFYAHPFLSHSAARRGTDRARRPTRNITHDYANGWLTNVREGTSSWGSITYHGNGMVDTVTHNNLVQSVYGLDPQKMQRPASVTAKYGTTTYWTSGTYLYDSSGNVRAAGNDYYVYDLLGRLTQGTSERAASTIYKQQNQTYDVYGNITNIATVINGSTTNRAIAVTAASNRLTNASYDVAGNQLTWDGIYTYGYDSQNMMRSLLSSNRDILYLYTADDERVWEYDLLANRSDYTIRDLDKKVLRVFDENNGVWAWKKDMIHRAGAILGSASYAGSYHYTVDHLGTPRYISNASRGQVGKHAYYPFGQESTSDTQNQEFAKFTGHERDTNFTGTLDYLDYMHARYYNPMLGRFLGVDPVRGKAHLPQSLNRYAYVGHTPLTSVDPDGRDALLIVVSLGDAADEKAGHAALWVGDNATGFGISVFGTQFDDVHPTPEALVASYVGSGREVRTYLLKTTAEEDSKMIAFMKRDPRRAGVDDTKSIVFQNCSTAVANTLTAGGVIGHPRNVALEITGNIFTPKGLERSVTGQFGALAERLLARRIFQRAPDEEKTGEKR